MAHSSRGLGRRPLTSVTRVRIPYALPSPLYPFAAILEGQPVALLHWYPQRTLRGCAQGSAASRKRRLLLRTLFFAQGSGPAD
jgi:hypothetical protein